jgi:hypothetical protein
MIGGEDDASEHASPARLMHEVDLAHLGLCQRTAL